MINRLTDDLRSSRAEAGLQRLGRQKAMESPRHKKKRSRSVAGNRWSNTELEGALRQPLSVLTWCEKLSSFKSKGSKRRYKREKENREARAQKGAFVKARKQQGVQRRRDERAAARTARNAAEASKGSKNCRQVGKNGSRTDQSRAQRL